MIKAKKQYGQNFLKDSSVLTKIIQAIPNNVDYILEIGPGLGDLTRQILKNFPLTSYEIDSDLYKILKEEFSEDIKSGHFKLILTDANKVYEEEASFLEREYFLVANLPYYVATKMILSAYKDKNCQGFIVMIQKEVALKFSAEVKDKEYSALSILGNLQGKTELLFDVEAECFEPSPKVKSSVIKFIKEKPLFQEASIFKDEEAYENFCAFLKVAFSAPRKTLIKNLSSSYDKKLLLELLASYEISDKIRPHELNITLYLNIYEKVNYGKDRK